jgi:hypothetical protein
VPAGRQNTTYSTVVSTFDWDTFWTRLRGGMFLDALREDMRAHYDFVLIDSRTGLSDTAGICTVQLSPAMDLALAAALRSTSRHRPPVGEVVPGGQVSG